MTRQSPTIVERRLRYVGHKLRRLRVARGLIQSEVARAAGVGVAVVTRIECGQQLPSLLHLYRLARVYQVDPRSLLPGDRPADRLPLRAIDIAREIVERTNLHGDIDAWDGLRNRIARAIRRDRRPISFR